MGSLIITTNKVWTHWHALLAKNMDFWCDTNASSQTYLDDTSLVSILLMIYISPMHKLVQTLMTVLTLNFDCNAINLRNSVFYQTHCYYLDFILCYEFHGWFIWTFMYLNHTKWLCGDLVVKGSTSVVICHQCQYLSTVRPHDIMSAGWS